jgi:hypothetical protein
VRLQDLEPIEIKPFDFKSIQGLNFHDQVIQRNKYYEERKLLEEENRRRFLLKE